MVKRTGRPYIAIAVDWGVKFKQQEKIVTCFLQNFGYHGGRTKAHLFVYVGFGVA